MSASAVSSSPVRLEAHGWGWRHAGRRAWALHDLELRIEPGERVLLLGPSGSGKSTLLQAFAGVLGGDEEGEQEGRLLLDGAHPAARRGRAGLVLQDPDSQLVLARVGDDVAFACENLGVPPEEIWPRVRRALDAVGLEVALDRSTSALSGGQKQRLALAGALAMQPGLLLLDEPTANLDPDGVIEVRNAVGRVLEETGATLVVVEHRVDAWLPLIDRVVVLSREGGLLADGPSGTVLEERRRDLEEAGVWLPGTRPIAARPIAIGPGAGWPDALSRAALIEARGLVVGRAEPVLTGVDLVLEEGSAVALVGPNGSGKSTLALTLAGLLPSLDGALEARATLCGVPGSRHGRPLPADPSRWRSRELLGRIGMVFQEPEHQLLRTRVRDELEVGPRAAGLPETEIARRVDELLARLRLYELEAAHPFTLSGGEKRRLTVAAMLASAPRLMVLDEPTFGQDAHTWAQLVALLAELVAEGRSVLFATHDRLLVETLADRVIRVADGSAVPDAGAAP